MASYFIGDALQLARVPEPLDISAEIKQYGANNLYPQIVHAIMLRSPLTKSAVKLLSDFFRGDGFTNQGETVLNRYGDTLNDVLKKAAEDLAEFRGFAIHLNFTPGGVPVELTPVPFEYCRLGLPDDTGLSTDIKISNNWEGATISGELENVATFPIYSPMNKKVSNEGAIYYYSDLGPARYPLCSFDPILDNAQSDAEAQLFEVNNLVNGFHGGTIFKHYGPFEDDRAKDRFIDQVNAMTGAKGGNSSLILEVDEVLAGQNLIESLPANSIDTLFSQTTINIRDRVLQYFNIPGGLFAVAPQGSVFTVTELGSSYVYMNLRTRNDRRILERFFNKFIPAGEIKINSFESDQVLNEVTPQTGAAPVPDPTPPVTNPEDLAQ